jgi:hypothetical protein
MFGHTFTALYSHWCIFGRTEGKTDQMLELAKYIFGQTGGKTEL